MLRNNLNASSWKHIRTKLKQTVGHRVSACCQRPDTRLIRDLLTRHPVPSQAFRTPSVGITLTVRLPPQSLKTMAECARVPGFQRSHQGFFICSRSNILLVRVSRDSSQAPNRCLYALARRRTALRAGKQTVTDRWGRRPGEELAAGAAAVIRRKDSNWHLGTQRRADMVFHPANNNVSLIRSGPPGPPLSQEGGEGGPTSLRTRLMGSADSCCARCFVSSLVV